MKALVKYAAGPGNMEVREIPEPLVGPGQVKIEVKEAGICGSDLHIYNSDIAIALNPPVVPGHEFSGVIAETGEGVEEFEIGDRVVAEAAYYYCRECDYCRSGFYNLCRDKKSLGYFYNGAFARFTVVDAKNTHRLPDEIDFLSAAMLEPLACVTHAIYDQCHIEAGNLVVVSGPGAIGLMAAQVAKAEGATVVITGTDVDTGRLALAKKLGADYAVNAQQNDLQELAAGLSEGYGADVVLECSGAEGAIASGLSTIKKHGYYCQIGLTGHPVSFDIETICYKEIHFSGAIASCFFNWQKAMKLVRNGLVRLAPLASHHFDLDDWEEAFELFRNKGGVKLMLSDKYGEGERK